MSDLIRRQDVLKICDKYNGQGWVWSMIRKEVEELPPVTPQPCEDAIDRAEAIKIASGYCHPANVAKELAKLPPVTPQPKTGQYEKHIDHTDCIWYGNDSGCPVTCSQYRDGWNDAMDYIFKNGKAYQPYRHDG